MREFLNRLAGNRPLLSKLLIASFLVNILALATPIFVIQVLQRYVAYGVKSTLITLVVGILFIIIFEFFFRNIRHRMAREYELSNIAIANSVLNKLTVIKSHIFETASKFRNDIINRNINSIRNTFTASNILVILDVPFAAIFLLALFLIHYQLGILTLIFIVLPFAVNRYYGNKINKLSGQNEAISTNIFRIFDNAISRNLTVKFFNLIKPLTASWNIIANKIVNNKENLEASKNTQSSFFHGISSILTVAVIGWGATLAVDGQISVGALIGANILAARCLMPIVKFVQTQENIVKGEKASKEIQMFLSIPTDNGSGREIKEFKGSIQCSNLQFIYPKSKNPIFENLDLNLYSGQITVITGQNGSGKSTLIKVLSGILDFTKGSLNLDQIAINQVSLVWLREQLSYSPQEPTFLDGTLGENIIGSKKLEGDQFSKLLLDVDLLNFVNSHEKGINMVLDNRGEELPLGIRKRISHARSLVNHGKIVLMDEPTEGLDLVGKKAMIKLLLALKKEDKTVVVATNDQDIIDLSDQSVELNIK